MHSTQQRYKISKQELENVCKTSEKSIPGNFSPKLELGEDALKNCLKEKM